MKNIFIVGNLTSAYRLDSYVNAFLLLGYKNIYINNFNISKTFSFIVDIIMLIRSDVVFVPPLQHNNKLIRIAILFRKKIIVDFYMSYFDSNVYDHKKFIINSKNADRMKKIDLQALTNTDLTIFLNESERSLYLERLNININDLNSCIIPLVIPNKKSFSKLKYFKNESNIFKICWVGTYIPLHGLEKIIDSIEIVAERGANVQLTIWGDSEEKSNIYRNLVKRKGLDKNIIFVNDKWGKIDQWEEFIIENCDLTLGVFGNSDKAKTVLPNKVLDGIAFKTPVLTQNSLGVNEFFSDNVNIFTCENDPHIMAEKIIQIYNMPYSMVEPIVENSYSIFMDNFSFDAFKTNVFKNLNRYLE